MLSIKMLTFCAFFLCYYHAEKHLQSLILCRGTGFTLMITQKKIKSNEK